MKNLILISAVLLSTSALAKAPEPPADQSVSGGTGPNHCRAVCVLTSGKGLASMSFEGAIVVNGFGDTDIKALNNAMALCRINGSNVQSELVISYTVGNKEIGPTVIEGQFVKNAVLADKDNCKVK